MAGDEAKLIVSLEARTRNFERELAKARAAMDTETRAMEKRLGETVARIEGTRPNLKIGDAFKREGQAVAGFNRTAGLARYQLQNLGYQLNDVVSGLASGQSPFTLLAQQGGQVYQVLAGAKGGVVGGVASLGQHLASLVSPARIAVGVLAAVGVTGLAAFEDWRQAQAEITVALTGIGRASGATVADINKITETAASAATITVGEAREAALALISTGKIGKENLGGIIAASKDFARTFGLSMADASGELAKAFADPVAGAESLNQKLGFLDDKTRSYLRTLIEQNSRSEAQRVLLNSMAPSLVHAAELTSVWARAWESVKSGASGAFTAVGQAIDRGVTGGPAETRLEDLQRRREAIRQAVAEDQAYANQLRTSGVPEAQVRSIIPTLIGPEQELAKLEQRIAKVRSEIESAAREAADAQARRASLEAGNVIKAVSPEVAQLEELRGAYGKLKAAYEDPAVRAHMADLQQLEAAYDATKRALDTYIPPAEKEARLAENAAKSVDALSPAARAAAAREQRRLELAGTAVPSDQADRLIEAAGQQAGGGSSAQLGLERQRITLLGEYATVQDEVRAKEIEIQLAQMSGVRITREQKAAILDLARVQAEGAKLAIDGQYGVASSTALYAQKVAELNRVAKERNWSEQQYADALRITTRETEEAAKAAEVRKAEFPELKRLELDSGDLRKGFDATAVSGLNNLASSLADITMGTREAKAAWSDLGQTVTREILAMLFRMTVIAPIAQALQAILGGFGGGGTGLIGGLFGSLFGGAGGLPTMSAGGMGPDIPASAAHWGGMVGSHGFSRSVPAWAVANAPRAHTGLKSREMLYILERDEEVLTGNDRKSLGRRLAALKDMKGGGGGVMAVNVHPPSGTEAKVQERRTPSGMTADVFVKHVIAEDIANHGPLSQGFSDTFGLNRMVGRRR